MLMSQVPNLSVCVPLCVCVNPNRGYPIQDKIRPGRPYIADGAWVAKKSLEYKPTVEAQRKRGERAGSPLKWPPNVRKEMVTALRKVNQSRLVRESGSSCQVEERER